MDRGAWWATVHEVTKSQACFRDSHTHRHTHTHTHTHTHIHTHTYTTEGKRDCSKKED